MTIEDVGSLEAGLGSAGGEGLSRLLDLSQKVVSDEGSNGMAAADRDELVKALLEVIASGQGGGKARYTFGRALGCLGDPRLSTPSQDAYWATVSMSDGSNLEVGRFQVTTSEYQVFANADGYQKQELWTEAGWDWLSTATSPWTVRAVTPEAEPFVGLNQPVVGINWYEAHAYCNFVAARMLRFDERLWVVRGEERRPYPWGSPFGEGQANTKEEAIGAPCAVGIFLGDRTPEGICDLAGNVAEWTEDEIGGQHWVHPGSFNQPSMAAWAKARELCGPQSWSAARGFRLAREL